MSGDFSVVEFDSTTDSSVFKYFDFIEEFPVDIARLISLFKECDSEAVQFLKEIESIFVSIGITTEIDRKNELMEQLELLLVDFANIKSNQLEHATSINSLIKTKIREFKYLMKSLPNNSSEICHVETSENLLKPSNEMQVVQPKGRRGRKPKNFNQIPHESCYLMMLADAAIKKENENTNYKAVSKKRKRRTKKQMAEAELELKEESEESDQQPDEEQQNVPGPSIEIDDNEPVYCICSGYSLLHLGPMILCDNESCSIEWFHFNCVGIKRPPKGKWYCPKCRSKKSNVLKKELMP